MILPISTYGSVTLRKQAQEINSDYQGLNELINNMFDTMYKADGVGLAAPQVGLSIRLFVIDSTPMKEDYPLAEGFKQVFINPRIIEESGDEWGFSEGCLSVPEIRENVMRKENLKIEYLDENFVAHTEEFSGIRARVIQHEYDHLDGILFTDRVSALKKQLLRGKLNAITKGKFNVKYKVRNK